MSRKRKTNDKQSSENIRHNDILSRPLKPFPENAQRKCLTPSICKSSKARITKKSLSKQNEHRSRNRSSQRQGQRLKPSQVHASNIDLLDVYIPERGKKQKPHDSAWKFKNRPSSTLANARHAKHLQFNLQNLNQSVHRNEQDNYLKMKDHSYQQLDRVPHTAKELYTVLEEGRKYLNQNKFMKAADCFKKAIKLQGNEDSQTVYLLGMCYFHMGDYKECISYLSILVLKNQNQKKNLYFFLSISYKRIGLTEDALRVLNIAIQKFPTYYDALFFRGRLLSKQRKYAEAIEDFKACVKLDASKVMPFICMADCWRYVFNFEQAADLFTKALLLNPLDYSIMLKRAITYIQLNQLSEAKNDLDQIIKNDPFNSEADSFRGLLYYKTRNYNDAILCYEQSIKHNSSQKAVTKSIYQIAKIKIELRDFYGASYTLQRAESLEVDKKILEKIKLFTDGSTFLMKKKIKKGVQLLSQLIKKQNITQFIKPLAYSFRAYGFFCQYKFTQALNDLETLQKNGQSLDSASQYNKNLLEGIILTINTKFDQALHKFQSAAELKKSHSDPSIYQCLAYIEMYNNQNFSSVPEENSLIHLAQQTISSAIQKQDTNCNSYFIRSVIYYSMGLFKEAWDDIQEAIKKSDDHILKHFYLRALIYAGIGKCKQALGDFSNTISLMKDLKEKETISPLDEDVPPEKQIPQAYLNRAKCYLMYGQKKRAIQDLQAYISFKNLQDNEIHILVGRLLFSSGAAEDAIRSYNSYRNIDKNDEILMQRVKCFLLIKQLNLCLKDMQRIVQNGNQKMMFDYGCLQSLRQASKGTFESFEAALKKIKAIKNCAEGDGYIFSRADYSFYKGVFYFYLKQYQKALKNFAKSLKTKQNTQCLQRISVQDIQNQDFFDNRIFTEEQLNYNIGIVHLIMNNMKEATKYLFQYQSFKQILKQQAPKRTIDLEQPTDITPFPINNRLCSIFPAISTPNNPQIQFRLSFCLPKVTPPHTQLTVTEDQLSKLDINSTEPRPDAPWIKRNSFGVVFTQDVIGCEVDLNTQNDKSVQKQENTPDDPVRVDIPNDKSMEFQGYFSEQMHQQNRTKLKELLTLDPETEAKLAKLLKK